MVKEALRRLPVAGQVALDERLLAEASRTRPYIRRPARLNGFKRSASQQRSMPMRLRSLYLTAVALIAVASWLVLPSAAMAVPPPNDDFDSATVISSLPFTDSLNTTEATTAGDDPDCFGNGPTVWYSFTAGSDILVDANTFGSDYDTTISVYTGSRGSLTQIACNDDTVSLQSQVVFQATTGVTYFIMVGAFASGPGGNLQLTVQEALPPEISLSLDNTGFVDRQGVASISGSVSCNQPLGVNIGISLTQPVGRVVIQGFGGTFVNCEPPSVPWKVSISGTNGRFAGGRAHVEADAFACNSAGFCTSDHKSADIRLRGVRQ
jgi:hypothetical protein